MTKVYKLFKYNYTYYCQGSKERGTEYALLYVMENASFNNNRSVLYQKRNDDNYHKIDINSIEDLTINNKF